MSIDFTPDHPEPAASVEAVRPGDRQTVYTGHEIQPSLATTRGSKVSFLTLSKHKHYHAAMKV